MNALQEFQDEAELWNLAEELDQLLLTEKQNREVVPASADAVEKRAWWKAWRGGQGGKASSLETEIARRQFQFHQLKTGRYPKPVARVGLDERAFLA